MRVLRVRRGLRQEDVAIAADVSQSLISDIERGRLSGVTVGTLRRVFAAVDAGFDGHVLWRGAALDRLLDHDHSRLVGLGADRLGRDGWDGVVVEATYNVFGERGSIDLLGGMAARRAVVVEEIKTSLVSIEGTTRKLDEKVRLVRDGLAEERFGWRPSIVGRILVLPDTSTARRQVASHDRVLGIALPARGGEVRRWLRSPNGDMAGILFVTDRTIERRQPAAAIQRVRRAK